MKKPISPIKEIQRKKKKLRKDTIEEQGTHPYHEPYVEEGIVKEY